MTKTEPKQDIIQNIQTTLDGWKKDTKLFADTTIQAQQQIVQDVMQEVDQLREEAQKFSIPAIRNGNWFNEFIKAMLGTYAEKIIAGGGVEYFKKKYPGLTRDQIADKLCTLAMQYAAIAGGASGGISSAAVAATFGTAGGAAVVTVPTGVAAIVAEMLYTTRLQIRLVYDLSIIYGYPINVDDPEDLYKAFALAYGITFVSGNLGTAVKTFTPEVARTYVRGLIHGHTQAIQQIAIRVLGPRIGRSITQRAILRTVVPGISIAISSSWNYFSTQHIATAARKEFLALGRIRDAVRDVSSVLATMQDHAPLVVECMLAVITADGKFDTREQELFNQVIKYLNVSDDALKTVEDRVDISLSSVEQRLHTITDTALCETLAACIQLVAISDGELHKDEKPVVKRLLTALGHEMDENKLKESAKEFARQKNWLGNLGDVLTGTTTRAEQASEWVKKKFSKRTDKSEEGDDTEITDAQKTLQEIDKQKTEAGERLMAEIYRITAEHNKGELSDAAFAAEMQKLMEQSEAQA